MLSAISYCHGQKIAHRDLKPENVLLNTQNKTDIVKVIDFGTSQVFEEGAKMHQGYGTAYYIAPEVLKGDYNEKCDMWSIGVITFILLSGRPPFDGETDKQIFAKVKTGKYTMNGKIIIFITNIDPIWKQRSKKAIDFNQKLLNVNVEKRLSANEALRHPWIT